MGYHNIIFDCNCPYYDFTGEECSCTAYSLINGSSVRINPYDCYDIRYHDILILNNF